MVLRQRDHCLFAFVFGSPRVNYSGRLEHNKVSEAIILCVRQPALREKFLKRGHTRRRCGNYKSVGDRMPIAQQAKSR